MFCRVLDWNGLQNTVGYSTLNQGLSTSYVGDYSWGRLQLTDRQIAQAYTANTNDGVTGIIGPNGCGKSNIFEAIRWVMGESSSKSLRSSSMDDVIFNGTQNIPAKNFAEVSIELDQFKGNESQNFNIDDKKVVISRILERGVGSFFRINNKDVRAKDVSVLFYDSGSGPRSSSIITLSLIHISEPTRP